MLLFPLNFVLNIERLKCNFDISEKPEMHTTLRNFTFQALCLLTAAGSAACGVASTKNVSSDTLQNNQPVVIENKSVASNVALPDNRPAQPAPDITAASVAGTYKFNTYKNGSGNDNSLNIKDEGNGKLGLYISASYNYTNNGNESMHETEAEGEAQLKGRIATGTIKEIGGDGDRDCRVTINFSANQATVKILANCYTNVSLDGIYKKEKPKTAKRNAVAVAR